MKAPHLILAITLTAACFALTPQDASADTRVRIDGATLRVGDVRLSIGPPHYHPAPRVVVHRHPVKVVHPRYCRQTEPAHRHWKKHHPKHHLRHGVRQAPKEIRHDRREWRHDRRELEQDRRDLRRERRDLRVDRRWGDRNQRRS